MLNIKCGVRQVSILGPLLFIMYINDLFFITPFSDPIMFVDDTNLFYSHQDIKAISSCHSHKKRKDSLETRAVLLIFSLKLEIYGVAFQRIHQNSEKWWLLLSENDFEANFCYDYGANASQAV